MNSEKTVIGQSGLQIWQVTEAVNATPPAERVDALLVVPARES
jgi:hypothetical protein